MSSYCLNDYNDDNDILEVGVNVTEGFSKHVYSYADFNGSIFNVFLVYVIS